MPPKQASASASKRKTTASGTRQKSKTTKSHQASAHSGTRRATSTNKSGSKRKGGVRTASAYNLYMKNTLPEYKKSHPSHDHKQAFKAVAKQWATAPENPKNHH